jgi:hypothetical protein
MTRVFEFLLFANWLLFLGILLYAIYWSLVAIAQGHWKAANGQVVTRRQSPAWYCFGIVLLLAIAASLFAVCSSLVAYRQFLIDWLLGR